MPRSGNQSVMQIEVAAETLGAIDELEIQFVFHASHIGNELSRVAFRIIDEVSGMHVEEPRQQHAR